MILTKWQIPNRALQGASALGSEIDYLFNHALNRFLEHNGANDGAGEASGWSPVLDLYDNVDRVVVKAELPGMKKEDIHLNLQDDVLTISGERKEEKDFSTTETYRTERLLGSFQRSVRLPGEVQADQIKATYKDGILTVVLPKSEAAKPKNIPVNVN